MFHNSIHSYFVKKKTIFFLSLYEKKGIFICLAQLPYCLRILLESTVRNCNHISIDNKHVQQIFNWQDNTLSINELPFLPSQVIMHDFS